MLTRPREEKEGGGKREGVRGKGRHGRRTREGKRGKRIEERGKERERGWEGEEEGNKERKIEQNRLTKATNNSSKYITIYS